MSFKHLVLATAVSMTALTGAMPVLAKTQTVTWWDFLSGGDGVRMKSMIKAFNADHKDIKIKATTLDWGVPFYTKVRTAIAVGRGPDVMTYHLSRLPLGLSEKELSPITPTDMKNAGLTKSDFFSRAVHAATGPDGKLYAVPLDIHSIVLYYNKTYLKGTRFLNDKGQLTGINSLADFNEALKVAKKNGSSIPVTYATADDGGVYRVFYTLLAQQGGTLIDSKGDILPGDSTQKAIKAVQIMRSWHDHGYQPEQSSYQASVALFTSGKSAFQLNGVWEVPTMKDLQAKGKLGFQWGAVQVPKLLEKQTTWADSHSFAIPNQKISPAKRKAVMEVIGWMERHAITWATAGHIPAYKPVTESAAYKKMQPNATYAPLVKTATYDPRSVIAGVASPVYDAAINIISPAINGYMSPKQAVEQMKQELKSRLQK